MVTSQIANQQNQENSVFKVESSTMFQPHIFVFHPYVQIAVGGRLLFMGKKRIELDKGRIDLDQAGVNHVDLGHWKIDYSISWNLRVLPYCYTFFF